VEKKCVLVIESYDCLREAICKALSLHYRVVNAGGPLQALKIGKRENINAVFCDTETINMNSKMARKCLFKYRKKFFVFTGSLSREIPDFIDKYRFLPKPYRIPVLISLLRAGLNEESLTKI